MLLVIPAGKVRERFSLASHRHKCRRDVLISRCYCKCIGEYILTIYVLWLCLSLPLTNEVSFFGISDFQGGEAMSC